MKLTKVTETRQVPKTVMVEEEVPTGEITITLSASEASQLLRIVSHISGSPETSARRVADTLYDGLKRSGVTPHPVSPERGMAFPSLSR